MPKTEIKNPVEMLPDFLFSEQFQLLRRIGEFFGVFAVE
jgi:hypothetical protein